MNDPFSFPLNLLKSIGLFPKKVKDHWIFVFVYPLMAILAVHVGNDNPLSVLFQIPSYYSDLALAVGCTYGIGLYFRWLFQRIDKKFETDEPTIKRWTFQLVFGIILPVAVILTIESVYLVYLLEIPLAESSMLYLELPLIAIFCVVINLLYTILYIEKRNEGSELALTENGLSQTNETKGNIVVHSGHKSVTVPLEDIAHFSVHNKSAFLTTREGKQFLYGSSLSEMKADLPSEDFYQINRQVIANREAIAVFEQTDTRKLKIELKPPLNEEVFVSKMRAADFRRWIKEK